MSHELSPIRNRRFASRPVGAQRRHRNMSDVPSKNRRAELLCAIEAVVEEAKALHLIDTAFLLSVAHLDLQTKLNGISDSELQAFTEHIRSQVEDD